MPGVERTELENEVAVDTGSFGLVDGIKKVQSVFSDIVSITSVKSLQSDHAESLSKIASNTI